MLGATEGTVHILRGDTWHSQNDSQRRKHIVKQGSGARTGCSRLRPSSAPTRRGGPTAPVQVHGASASEAATGKRETFSPGQCKHASLTLSCLLQTAREDSFPFGHQRSTVCLHTNANSRCDGARMVCVCIFIRALKEMTRALPSGAAATVCRARGMGAGRSRRGLRAPLRQRGGVCSAGLRGEFYKPPRARTEQRPSPLDPPVRDARHQSEVPSRSSGTFCTS